MKKETGNGRTVSASIALESGAHGSRIVLLYRGGSLAYDARERGPLVQVGRAPSACVSAIASAQIIAGGGGSVMGVDFSGVPRRVLVFAPSKLTEARFLSIAGEVKLLGVEQTVTAWRNLKWIATDLRGSLFLDYAARIMGLFEPEACIIWPLEFHLHAARDIDRLLDRWRVASVSRFAAPIDSQRDDDSEDWWRAGNH